jgi:hypothetical protein
MKERPWNGDPQNPPEWSEYDYEEQDDERYRDEWLEAEEEDWRFYEYEHCYDDPF